MIDYHRELIDDEQRTAAYRDAIRHYVRPDSVVLDLGCGSGILSLFACEAGARHVYAIDFQHAADLAALLARQCGFAERITVIHDKSFDVTLPEKAGILVNELMGGFALEEGMLGSVIDARMRLLKQDAVIIPAALQMRIAAVEYPEAHDRLIGWWQRPHYGFDLCAVHMFASNVFRHEKIPPSALLTDPATVIAIDFSTITTQDVSGRAQLRATRDGIVHGFAGWFHATLAPGIEIEASCGSSMHWYQAFLALEEPVAVRAGTAMEIELQSHNGAMSRWSGTIHTDVPVTFDQMTRLSRPPCIRSRP